MRSVTVLCVGKLKEAYWRSACAEYAKRLGGFCRFSVLEVDEERVPEHASPAQIEAALTAEGRRLLARVGNDCVKAALCIEGRTMTSPELSAYFDDLAVHGQGDIAFLIGGSWGLSEEAKAACSVRLSMSVMTFPHQLARVMLLEQIYRAMQISAGGKYHK